MKIIFLMLLLFLTGCSSYKNNIYEKKNVTYVRESVNKKTINSFNCLYLYMPFSRDLSEVGSVVIKNEESIITIAEIKGEIIFYPKIFGLGYFSEPINVVVRGGKKYLRVPFYHEEYKDLKNKNFNLSVVLNNKNNNLIALRKFEIKDFSFNNEIKFLPKVKTKIVGNKYIAYIEGDTNKILPENMSLIFDYRTKNNPIKHKTVNFDSIEDFKKEYYVNLEYPTYFASVMLWVNDILPGGDNIYMYKVVNMDKSDPFFGKIIRKENFYNE